MWGNAATSVARDPRAPDARLDESGVRKIPRPPPFLDTEIAGAALLSAVAGYVDAAGFLALFGMFTAHVTGDLVAAGAVFTARWRLGVGARLLMIPVFMSSVAATTLVARFLGRRGKNPVTGMLALLTAALAVFCAAGVFLLPFADGPDAFGVALIGGTGVVAMGIQNTLMRDALRGLSPTTIMTGNLTQFTIDLVEMAFPARQADVDQRARARREVASRLVKFGVPVAGFVVGALLGAWLTNMKGLYSIALPTIVAGALTFGTWRGSRLWSS